MKRFEDPLFKNVIQNMNSYHSPEVSDDEVIDLIKSVPEHYSANTIVDIGGTAQFVPSLSAVTPVVSGAVLGLSGVVIGQWVDMSNSDTFCNVYVAAGACSGPILIQVQCAPGPNDIPYTNAFSGNIFSGGAPLSGNFTDPTSGLAQLPTWFSSGGILIVNSGLYTNPGQLGASGQLVNNYSQGTLPFGPNPIQNSMGGNAFVGSGAIPEFASGGIAFAAFQRPFQYVRLNLLSGATTTTFVQAGLLSNKMTTSSGGGFSQQPFQSTFVNV